MRVEREGRTGLDEEEGEQGAGSLVVIAGPCLHSVLFASVPRPCADNID